MKAYSRYFFLLLVLSYLSIEEVISWGEDAVFPLFERSGPIFLIRKITPSQRYTLMAQLIFEI